MIAETRGVRLDKWLWAARFFRTRARARQAIDAGHVLVNGHRAKPAREIAPDTQLQIRQGFDVRVVHVRALSDVRRGAPEAATLYEETPASVEARTRAAAERRAARNAVQLPDQRPDRRDRRALARIKKEGE